MDEFGKLIYHSCTSSLSLNVLNQKFDDTTVLDIEYLHCILAVFCWCTYSRRQCYQDRPINDWISWTGMNGNFLARLKVWSVRKHGLCRDHPGRTTVVMLCLPLLLGRSSSALQQPTTPGAAAQPATSTRQRRPARPAVLPSVQGPTDLGMFSVTAVAMHSTATSSTRKAPLSPLPHGQTRAEERAFARLHMLLSLQNQLIRLHQPTHHTLTTSSCQIAAI